MPNPAGGRRTETQSIETAASCDEVVALLADAPRLAEWAPGFVDEVSGDRSAGWVGSKDGRTFALRVVVDVGAGSVVAMTLPYLPGVDPADTTATLTQELSAIVALVEGPAISAPGAD
jgi:hypothetical protein